MSTVLFNVAAAAEPAPAATDLIQGPQGQLPSTRPRGAAAGGHSTLSCEDARVANAIAAGLVCVFVKRRELPG